MSEFLKVLLNIRSLRAVMRELSLEQVKEAHEKIESIYLERLELAEKEQAANAEHQQIDWPLEDPDTSPLLT